MTATTAPGPEPVLRHVPPVPTHRPEPPAHIIDQADAALAEAATNNRRLDAGMVADNPRQIYAGRLDDPTTLAHQLLIANAERITTEPRLVCAHDDIIEPSFTWMGRHQLITCTRRACLAAAVRIVSADRAAGDYCALCGPVDIAPRLIEFGAGLGRVMAPVCRAHRRGDKPRRNEPCPCGSGAKYKRCHGAPS